MTPASPDAPAGRRPLVTDVCLITPDLEGSIGFYTDTLGFTLRSRMPGFADFHGPGMILALWESERLTETTGIHGQDAVTRAHGVMLACELDTPAAIDAAYDDLRHRGVRFYGQPENYPWNARCAYFAGPNGELWELFAWYEGGEPGLTDKESPA